MRTLLLVAAAAAAPSTPAVRPGITAAAPATIKGDPVTFDLAGFRLGMSEAEIEAVIRARGMKVRNRERTYDFETRVRQGLNLRGQAGGPGTGRTVLSKADLDDGRGGKVILYMLGWPEGARVKSVVYLVPPGTAPQDWRQALEAKYGPADEAETASDGDLNTTWCGNPGNCLTRSGPFRLHALVGDKGGTVELSSPAGLASKLGDAVQAEVTRRGRTSAPVL